MICCQRIAGQASVVCPCCSAIACSFLETRSKVVCHRTKLLVEVDQKQFELAVVVPMFKHQVSRRAHEGSLLR